MLWWFGTGLSCVLAVVEAHAENVAGLKRSKQLVNGRRCVSVLEISEEVSGKQGDLIVVVKVSKLRGGSTAKANDFHGEVEW